MLRYLLIAILLSGTLAVSGQTGDLPRSTPMEQDVDTVLLNDFIQSLTTLPNVDVHHLMILRHGKVIVERHYAPYRATDLHTLYSASKTVTGLAVGLAVEDGLLTIDDKVSKFLRDKMPEKLSPALDSLTVRHLLTMTSGRKEDLSILMGEADWLTTWFAGDFSGAGTQFNYDSMCSHALAMIVSRLTGRSLLDYVDERIFKPLNITTSDWELAPDSIEAGGWGLRLHVESEAKLGQLMLQEGVWNGQQLISSNWIHDMTQRHVSTRRQADDVKLPLTDRILNFFRSIWHEVRSWFTGYNIDDYFLGYGYQIKAIQRPFAECYFAAGYGGQIIYVVPKCDMVVVFNGRAATYGDELNALYDKLIEPMVRGEHPSTALTIDSAPRVVMPSGNAEHPLEQRLFAGTVELEDNLLGMQSIKVAPQGVNRIFTMTDQRGPLRAVASCGEWCLTTSDERPIYIMETREQLVGTKRPFTSAATYAWHGDTLNLRLDWLDGGDNRRLKIAFNEGNNLTVIANDNYDALLNDTIQAKLTPDL